MSTVVRLQNISASVTGKEVEDSGGSSSKSNWAGGMVEGAISSKVRE